MRLRNRFWRLGEPFVWLSGVGLTATLGMTVVVLLVVLANGLGFFWPDRVVRFDLEDGGQIMGEVVETETFDGERSDRLRIKVGNRDVYGQDFRWITSDAIVGRAYPVSAVALEREEYGNFYGFIETVEYGNLELNAPAQASWVAFERGLAAVREQATRLAALQDQLDELNIEADQVRNRILKLAYDQGDRPWSAEARVRLRTLEKRQTQLRSRFEQIRAALAGHEAELRAAGVVARTVDGRTVEMPFLEIVRAWRPNTMSITDRAGFYAAKVWELLTDDPREANTEGGIFPAIFGTVLMVFLMSLFSVPFGVIAAIYLREYASDGRFVRLVRISVNNLAGVPSIVYGVFGLGFFIYTVGSAVDELFYPHLLPSPTFGTGGILWASLTLGLLTVPVVIVSTEEALAAIPKQIREGSLALGATRFQTLTRVLLPMSTPGIMTGLVLSMARAAGEVAPLMLVGAVKLAPDLPLSGEFPFLHLDRKFMHLGFHIYDLAFQSPNVEAVLPMVYVTTMLLLGIVILLSGAAIWLRERMRRRYTSESF